LASALGLLLGPPVGVLSFGIFLKALVADFHASRSAVSFAFTLFNVMAAISVPLVGWMIDRWGPRRVILPATVVYAVVLISATTLGSKIWMFYLFYAALGFSSGGPHPVPYAVVVSRWFNRNRGLALGVMLLGVGTGAIVVPLLAQRLLTLYGWRGTYGIIGLLVLLAPLPVVTALLEYDPKDRGLLPDGDAPASTTQSTEVDGLTWQEIWHTPLFWLLVTIVVLTGASVHAGVLHMAPLLTDRGLTAERAALASSVMGASLLFSRVACGYCLDHFFGPRVAVVFFGACAIGMGILAAGATGNLALLAAFLTGLGMGAESDIIAFFFGRYFGLRAFGTAYGNAFAAFMLAGAAGTLLMGAGYDLTHSYTKPLVGFVSALLIALLLLTRLGPYRYVVAADSSSQEVVTAGAPA